MIKKLSKLSIFIVIFAGLLSSCANKKSQIITHAKTELEQSGINPAHALKKLEEGNLRFLNKTMRKRDFMKQILSSKKQFPFAVILNCMDSRGSPEILFDQGIGDIFVERLAGNVVNTDVLAGMEYATKIVGAKLIVVLGHTSCGAVKGACEKVKLGNLTKSLKKIEPAVSFVREENPQVGCNDKLAINAMALENVRNAIHYIKKHSPVIRAELEDRKIEIVGGMHDIKTGKVTFFAE